MPETPITYAAARAVLAEYGHVPRTRDLLGNPLPADHGWEPVDLTGDMPEWWPPPYFGDWVSGYLSRTSGPGPVVYRFDDHRKRGDARSVLSFRPVDRNHRPRWGIYDGAGRSNKPLDALLTVLSDLDRLSALVTRCRELATYEAADARADLWQREAAELAEFAAGFEARHVGPRAAQWLATAPRPPRSTPTRPPMVAAHLR